jgi:hypothetical protein
MLEWQSDWEVYSEALNNRNTLENSRIELGAGSQNHAGGVERSDTTNKDNADVIFLVCWKKYSNTGTSKKP